MTTNNVAGEPDPGSKVRLVLLSFLMLFVELGLIRWAGAYNVYGLGGLFVESLSGSPSNVAGLPVRLLLRLVREAGVDLGWPPS